ncbi:uncharacterized protein MONBRDRAFT_22480 [Monosiga brevicollis MX1]|uniref:Uncharacterized protein n=1 Tax=Monosiga brevicollis TaxID=81824 RepID=A9UQQ1_MONBE|nr:uncharacterized protein MONBRDRAFT_22480 [Monosiga brevicollis MX1]EDQ93085.1 predicted protein [Monosiga brevicollis MX1]|eukprot:XP_001742847.1 hypothetical protein [Monosiga brevicollis MX1]
MVWRGLFAVMGQVLVPDFFNRKHTLTLPPLLIFYFICTTVIMTYRRVLSEMTRTASRLSKNSRGVPTIRENIKAELRLPKTPAPAERTPIQSNLFMMGQQLPKL